MFVRRFQNLISDIVTKYGIQPEYLGWFATNEQSWATNSRGSTPHSGSGRAPKKSTLSARNVDDFVVSLLLAEKHLKPPFRDKQGIKQGITFLYWAPFQAAGDSHSRDLNVVPCQVQDTFTKKSARTMMSSHGKACLHPPKKKSWQIEHSLLFCSLVYIYIAI